MRQKPAELAEVKIEVECEIGRRLSAIERKPGEGGHQRTGSSMPLTGLQSAVAEGGWSRQWCDRWQIMAGWTTLAERREYYARQNDADVDITSADVYRMARTKKSQADIDDLRSQPVATVDGIYEAVCRAHPAIDEQQQRAPGTRPISDRLDQLVPPAVVTAEIANPLIRQSLRMRRLPCGFALVAWVWSEELSEEDLAEHLGGLTLSPEA